MICRYGSDFSPLLPFIVTYDHRPRESLPELHTWLTHLLQIRVAVPPDWYAEGVYSGELDVISLFFLHTLLSIVLMSWYMPHFFQFLLVSCKQVTAGCSFFNAINSSNSSPPLCAATSSFTLLDRTLKLLFKSVIFTLSPTQQDIPLDRGAC